MKNIYLILSMSLLSIPGVNAQNTPSSFHERPVIKTDQQEQQSRQQSQSGTREDFGPAPAFSLVSVFDNGPINDTTESFSLLEGLELDNEGNLYHYGFIDGNAVAFGAEIEGYGVFVTKTNAQAETEWTLIFPNTRADGFGNNIKVNPADGSIYVVGAAPEGTTLQGTTLTPMAGLESFVAKITTDGELEWIQNMPGEPQGIDLDSEENIYVSGIYEDPFTLENISGPAPGGPADAYLVKLTSAGDPLWVNLYGGEDYEFVGLVAIGAEDEIYFSGEFPSRNISMPNGGSLTLTAADGDIFLAKLDTDGTTEWAQVLGAGPGNERLYGWPTNLAVTPEGNAALVGWVGKEATFGDVTLTSPYQGNNFVATILPDGSTKWASIIRTDFSPFNYNEMGLDAEGNIYVGGMLEGAFEFPDKYSGNSVGFYVAKYDADGSLAYVKTVDAFSTMLVGGFAISKEDDIFVNGYFADEATFDETTYNTFGPAGYLINLANEPEPPLALEVPAEPITAETSVFILKGKGLADEVIVQITPAEAVNSYRIEGNQLIINWNMDYEGTSGGRIAEIVQVTIEIAYRNNSGTSEFSEPIVVLLNTAPTGIEEHLFGGALKLYPNPSDTYIKLEFPQNLAGEVSVRIKDITGRTVVASSIPAGSNSMRLHTEDLPQGMYLMQLSLADGNTAKRFIKK